MRFSFLTYGRSISDKISISKWYFKKHNYLALRFIRALRRNLYMYVPHQIAYLFTYSFDDNNVRYPWLDYLLVMLSTVSTPELCFGWITISKMGILATTVEYIDSVYTRSKNKFFLFLQHITLWQTNLLSKVFLLQLQIKYWLSDSYTFFWTFWL